MTAPQLFKLPSLIIIRLNHTLNAIDNIDKRIAHIATNNDNDDNNNNSDEYALSPDDAVNERNIYINVISSIVSLLLIYVQQIKEKEKNLNNDFIQLCVILHGHTQTLKH
jgi:hypothetical protein